MYGINLNPILPLRTAPQEQAELCTQLLFGELFTIVEKNENWLLICNENDKYKAWLDRKMATIIDEKTFNFLSSSKPLFVFKPFAECLIKNKNETIFLPAGSLLRFYDFDTSTTDLMGNYYQIPPEVILKKESTTNPEKLVLKLAKSFINAPYLWGGKSIFGVDCSGLVQICFNICGIDLPRDANQQVEKGKPVKSLQEAIAGDLAFFENEKGKITHVGILLDNSYIIHASGKVKIEKIDSRGIISQENGSYTHKLKAIKRFFD